MDTLDLALGVGGVAVLYAAYKKYGGTTTTVAAAKVPVYYSPATFAALKADGHRPWREPQSDEYDSMCGTYSTTFPNACEDGSTPGYWNHVNISTILSWFKGMNIDPVHHQDYATLYHNDIQTFFDTAPQTYYEGVVTGGFLPGGVYGISRSYARVGDLQTMGCLG